MGSPEVKDAGWLGEGKTVAELRRLLDDADEQLARLQRELADTRHRLEQETQARKRAEQTAESLRSELSNLEAQQDPSRGSHSASREEPRNVFSSRAEPPRSAAHSVFDRPSSSAASAFETKTARAWGAFQSRTQKQAEPAPERSAPTPVVEKPAAVLEPSVKRSPFDTARTPDRSVEAKASPPPVQARGFGSAEPFKPKERVPESRSTPVKTPAPAERREAAPTPAPGRAAPVAPAVLKPSLGLGVLDALETDPQLSHGQKETLRGVYARFAQVGLFEGASLPSGTTVGDILDKDPNLKRGQKEALRTMYETFQRKSR